MSGKETAVHPRVESVIHDDMCIACGACIEACPYGVISPSYSELRGSHEVQVLSHESCTGCEAPCERVCPSIEVDLVGLLRKRESVDRAGPIMSMWTGYAPEFRDDGISSSGGVLRAIIAASVHDGVPVICLVDTGGRYAPGVVQSPEQLVTIPGSIYHSVSYVGAIEKIRSSKAACVLVATPCQLEGIVKYIDLVDPALDSKIALKVGLICGWMYSFHALDAFATFKGFCASPTTARYRGDGEVGSLQIVVDGDRYSFARREFANRRDRLDYSASFSRFTNRLRCRVCEDHVNVLADLAIGDAWLERKQGEKLSLVVVRTGRGERMIESLRHWGTIILEEASESDLFESQSIDLVAGRTARALNTFLQNQNVSVPKFNWGRVGSDLKKDQWTEFRIERLMRSIVRNRRYRFFRSLYAARVAIRRVRSSL